MSKPLRVLMVEDSEDDALLTIHAIEKGGYEPEYERVEDAGAMRKALEKGPWDVILCDYQMPKFDGLSAIALLKETGIDIPMIIVSGAIGEETAVECMRSGACDFFMKGKLSRLSAAIERELQEAKSKIQRKRAEEALRKREEYFRAITENASDIILVVDKKSAITYASLSVERILGYKPEELISKSSLDLIVPADYQRAIHDFGKAVLAKGALVPNAFRVRHKDGSERVLEGVGRNLYKNPSVAGFVMNVRDVTDNKEAEEALQKSEAQLSNALEMAHLGHWEYDVADDLFTFNDHFYKIFRTTVEKVGGYTMHSAEYAQRFVHPDDMVMVGEENRKAIETTDPHFNRRIEHRMLYADGTVGYITVRFFVVKDSHGRTVKTYGVNQDITDRKQAEREIQQSEERFRVIFERSTVGKSLTAPDGKLLRINKALSDMLGYTIEEIQEINFAQITHPDDVAEGQECIRTLLAGEQTAYRFEKRYIHKSGNIVWVDLSTTLLRDEKGTPLYLITSIVDITNRKRAEKQLQDTLESLRKAVNTTIQVMVSAVEIRDPYTAGHQMRSADLARAIAAEVGLPQEKIDGIRMVGTIHDIGKLSIPSEILSKPTKLSEIEFSLIKEHARRGFEMLKDVDSPWPLAEIVYQHHERMDGSGYPRNLKRGEILIEARILAVADTVEAMASHRPYRPSLGIEAALNEIEKNRGIFYDNAVADACMRLFREKGFKFEGTC